MRRDTPPSREKGKSIAGDVAACLRSGGNGGVPSSRGEHLVCAFDMQRFGQYGDSGLASSCKARDYKDATDLVAQSMQVRRLTPIECERLQGFPETEKNIILSVWNQSDSQEINALAEMQCHKSQSNAFLAEESVSSPTAKYVDQCFSIDQETKNAPVAVNVLINYERKEVRYSVKENCFGLRTMRKDQIGFPCI